ncbi:protein DETOXIFICATION 44, chloroplastic-like [Salvia miltiorrhiza]|uniref:protein DETOXIFICATION 44, chloroplastic-like n=1 Tax=Salvia miltiorrhiza TaxID=226208 RepID=UPI0025ACB10A|nr:protein DETOXIFICATION 44, chloroplastic-like [Salvia miltiorrhiza]XP_057801154.1 protein DETOXIFICATION 44, chloroplastic-like [Salvia miltiorrhiza]XP_057801155.1 protein DETOXIFICATION 44, chloroplastic-like [Salvia miltiorrhiza]
MKCANGYGSIRFRTVAKSSANKNPSTIPEKPKLPIQGNRIDDSDLEPYLDQNLFSSVMHRLRAGIKLDGLGMEILSIALPAALALIADPITSLVDTGFVGHIDLLNWLQLVCRVLFSTLFLNYSMSRCSMSQHLLLLKSRHLL